jgi:iron complex outermembrane recepter protein
MCGTTARLLLSCAPCIALCARADPTTPTDVPSQLEEVVVTAQHRAENSQTVPLSIATLSAEELRSGGVFSSVSLSQAVPGLMFMQAANNATPFIRGVGSTTSSVGSESSVATYIDGVYVSSLNGTLFEFNNVAHVEVLKGPQGTLFGRNATGGVVNIVTPDPAFAPSAALHVGYGNYDTSSASFYGTTGLGDNVAADLALYGRDQSEGWGVALVSGDPTFTRHHVGGRSKLLWQPSERTSVVVAADYDRARNEDGLGYHVWPGSVGTDGVSRYNGFYDTYDDPNDFSNVSQTGVSITARQDFSTIRLVSITSTRNLDGFFSLDQDATPLVVSQSSISQHDRTFTQEVQLLSQDGASLPWITGVYYYDDVSAYDPLASQGASVAPLNRREIWSSQHSKSRAAFAQITPEVANGTHLTLGVRYTRDERSLTGSTLGFSGAQRAVLASASQDASWSKTTWRVALDHDFTANVMAYVSADRGFKSGVYNLVSYAAPPVRPETIDAYQLGVKSEFAQHRMRFNATAFYYDYQDMQLQKIVTGATVLINAAGAVIKGLDTDLTWVPTDALTVSGGFSLMRGHYTSFRDAPFFTPIVNSSGRPLGGNRQSVGDATGFDTVRTPDLTATLSAEYRLPMLHRRLVLAALYSYNSGFAWDPDNRLREPSYDLVNFSIGWSAVNDAWGARLWSRNLTGTEYCAYSASRTLLDSCSPAPPRTYGITFDLRF